MFDTDGDVRTSDSLKGVVKIDIHERARGKSEKTRKNVVNKRSMVLVLSSQCLQAR